MKESLVNAGIITSTTGLKGYVRIKPFVSEVFNKDAAKFILSPPTIKNKKLTLENVEPSYKTTLNVKFKEINDIGEAQELISHMIQIPRSELPSACFQKNSLIGAEVFTKTKKKIGSVKGVEKTNACDMLIVTNNGKEIRFSISKETVLKIDLKDKKITVNIEEGYLKL